MKQLEEAIEAVFKSWDNECSYLNDIPHDIGTAVNIQEMVFGNSGDNSGTGVAFTRNPVTGEINYLVNISLNAQGEDVVAGIRKISQHCINARGSSSICRCDKTIRKTL